MALLGVDLPLRTVRNESLYWEADELPNNARSNFKIVIISDGSPDTDGSFIIPEYEYPGLIKVNTVIWIVSTYVKNVLYSLTLLLWQQLETHFKNHACASRLPCLV